MVKELFVPRVQALIMLLIGGANQTGIAAFSACTTLLRISFISPGRMTKRSFAMQREGELT